MEFTLISDTHNSHNQLDLTKGDILLHSGDISLHGTEKEFFEFIDWFKKQPYKYKIFIAGNHDFFIYEKGKDYIKDICRQNDIIYLQDDLIIINDISIYGTPWVPVYKNMAFNLDQNELYNNFNLIPNKIDILLTHTPPFKVLDYVPRKDINAGCKILSERLSKVDFRICSFGHIHEGNGLLIDKNKTFINSVPQMTYDKTSKTNPYTILQKYGTKLELK
jgi:Icc-related predicted phosphoesterase